MTIRSIGAYFEDALAFYSTHLSLLLGIAIAPALIEAVTAYLDAGMMDASPLAPFVLILTIATVVVSVLSSAAMVLAVSAPERFPDAFAAYGEALKFFLPLLWLTIIQIAVLFLGFALFIVPGIIFLIWYAFSSFTFIIEGKRGWNAMKASKAYVSGRWFLVFGRIVPIVLAIMLASLVVNFVLGMVMPTEMLSVAVSSLVSAFFMPFAIAYMYFLYKDLRVETPTTSGPGVAEPVVPPVAPQAV